MKRNWKSLPLKLYSGLLLALPSLAEKAYRADEAPQALQNLAVKEQLGTFIDLQLSFVDEQGQSRALKSWFGKEPVLMSIVYYNCPSLCNFHLNGLFEGLNQLSQRIPYQLVIVSMDHKEKPPLAQEKKANYLKKFPQLKKDRVHFLTGREPDIKKLSKSLGFAFRWDEETLQFAHSPVAYVLSPKGKLSRYLYGVQFSAKTLKLSLLEGGAGKIGNMIDRIVLFCYRFNPEENKYSLYAGNIMKAGGVLIILALLFLLIPTWIKEGRKNS